MCIRDSVSPFQTVDEFMADTKADLETEKNRQIDTQKQQDVLSLVVNDSDMKPVSYTHLTSITNLVALLICLAPTTIGALLSAIGIAGMSRLNQANVLAMSGRAVSYTHLIRSS